MCFICRQTISCFYVVSESQTVAFSYKPRSGDPIAEVGSGQLVVQVRLAHGEDELGSSCQNGKEALKWLFGLKCPPDASYDDFYHEEEYPVVKYLRQPLYFEVGLLDSHDPQLELMLENCWATADQDRTSTPSWDIIVDG